MGKSTGGGGGPSDPPDGSKRALILQSFEPFVFGIAMAVGLLVLALLVHIVGLIVGPEFAGNAAAQLAEFGWVEWVLLFSFGGVAGIVISGTYNFLVMQRDVLTGLESSSNL